MKATLTLTSTVVITNFFIGLLRGKSLDRSKPLAEWLVYPGVLGTSLGLLDITTLPSSTESLWTRLHCRSEVFHKYLPFSRSNKPTVRCVRHRIPRPNSLTFISDCSSAGFCGGVPRVATKFVNLNVRVKTGTSKYRFRLLFVLGFRCLEVVPKSKCSLKCRLALRG